MSQENAHTVILKFNGIYPNELSRLHELLRNARKELCPLIPAGGANPGTQPELLSSRFEPGFGTYTIELKLPVRWWPVVQAEKPKPGSQNWMVPRKLIDKIFDTLEVFPEEKKVYD